MLLAIYLLVWGKVTEDHARPEKVNLWLGGILSFGVGFLSSVLGIGGGVIHVPLLIQFLGYPAQSDLSPPALTSAPVAGEAIALRRP